GVGAESDEGMERFGRLAQHLREAPAAGGSLAGKGDHGLPGLGGLEEPCTCTRSVTLRPERKAGAPIQAESAQKAQPAGRATLGSLAHVCGAELRLRLLVQRSRKARTHAQNAYERSQRLVRTADELAGTADLVAVRRSVKALVTRDLRPVQVELMVVEDNRL